MADPALTPAQNVLSDELTTGLDGLQTLIQEITAENLVAPIPNDETVPNLKLKLVGVKNKLAAFDPLMESARELRQTLRGYLTRANAPEAQILQLGVVIQPVEGRLHEAQGAKRSLQQQGVHIQARLDALNPNAGGNNNVPPRVNRPAKLPQLVLAKFTGKKDDFRKWMELFRVSVHNQAELSDTTKFAHLQSLLEDPPTKIISGLPFTDAGYAQALELLTKEYVKEDDQDLESILKALQCLENVTSLSTARKFRIEVESLCRRMETLGQSPNEGFLRVNLEEKLNRGWKEKLLTAKEARPVDVNTGRPPAWDKSEFRKTFDKIFLFQEKLGEPEKKPTSSSGDEALQGSKSPKKGYAADPQAPSPPPLPSSLAFPITNQQRGKHPKSPKKQSKTSQSATDSSSNDSDSGEVPFHEQILGKSQERQRRSVLPPQEKPCYFCGEPHWSEKCMKFPTSKARCARAMQLKICVYCLKSDHGSSSCSNKKSCYHCKKIHHSILCPVKFAETTKSKAHALAIHEDQKD
jgi:hypothetical protein